MSMGPVATFGDAQVEVAAVLRTLLDERTEDYVDGVEVGSKVPTIRSIDDPQLPYVLVAVDAPGEIVYPIVARPTVRVTVWHVDEDQAFGLAALCMGLLCAYSGDVLASSVPLILPARVTDPDSDAGMATCTVRSSMGGSLVP